MNTSQESIDSDTQDLSEHPVQLMTVALSEVQFKTDKISLKDVKVSEFQLGSAQSKYVVEDQCIDVLLIFEAGDENLKAEQFFMRVSIRARFKTDSVYPEAKIEAWAERGAKFILFPYLREQVYSLSIRAGMPPITIPLYRIPGTGRLEAPLAKAAGLANPAKHA